MFCLWVERQDGSLRPSRPWLAVHVNDHARTLRTWLGHWVKDATRSADSQLPEVNLLWYDFADQHSTETTLKAVFVKAYVPYSKKSVQIEM